MRERLEKNIQLNLKNNNLQKTFIIDSFVGEGASCLVYDAKYIDELGFIRYVRIKELYPLECKEVRNYHHIIWPNEDRKNYYIAESLDLYGGVVINTYSKSNVKDYFPYVVLMDEL